MAGIERDTISARGRSLIVYVETNFVLELAFQQEESRICEEILNLAMTGSLKLLIPAYSLAEPHEKLIRQDRQRKDLQRALNTEIVQLSRNSAYSDRVNRIQDISELLTKSSEEELQQFLQYRQQLLQVGEIIPLTSNILILATEAETTYDLSPQDAIVYASVITSLQQIQPNTACFLNRNSKDFDLPGIVSALNQYNCRMIPRFQNGYSYIQSRIT
jgi:predicted nucleic acid-binding protein